MADLVKFRSSVRLIRSSMVKHLSPSELHSLFKWRTAGMEVADIHWKIVQARRRKNMSEPDVTTIRRALKGRTFKRGRAETRGRKKKLSSRNVKSLDAARKGLIKHADGEREVLWEDVMRKARVPVVHRSTAYRSMSDAGYNVKWRPAREKPMRTDIDEAERKRICNRWRKLPASYWLRRVDLYMDNKRWDVPVSARGGRFLRKTKVRGHLRTPEEGLKRGFTKPSRRLHKVNTGGHVNVCAGIVGCRVKIWHYLPPTWSGAVAESLYRDVVYPALVKHRGKKRTYTILEDNDPTGYKSKVAKTAKAELGIVPIEFPVYSPDLNPLDFALWSEVSSRMDAAGAPRRETLEAYKARLRRTALGIPEAVVRKMLSSMKGRVSSVYESNGGHIPRD